MKPQDHEPESRKAFFCASGSLSIGWLARPCRLQNVALKAQLAVDLPNYFVILKRYACESFETHWNDRSKTVSFMIRDRRTLVQQQKESIGDRPRRRSLFAKKPKKFGTTANRTRDLFQI